MFPETWTVNWFSGIGYWVIWILISYYIGEMEGKKKKKSD